MTKVLLVEDHEELWDILSRRLTRRGFTVILAHDGQQGLASAQTELPDIILLDMNLPVMDGWTVASKLRADPRTACIPVIALTAHAMASDKSLTLAAGCDDYHPKPVDFPQLLAQIDAALLGRADEA